jgi:hypothetical protein
MIHLENVKTYADARERLATGRYSWRNDSHSQDSDRLIVFTTESRAQEESRLNLEHFCLLGKTYQQRYLVVSRARIQFVGHDHLELIKKSISKEAWYEQYQDRHAFGPTMYSDTTELGGVLHLRMYDHGIMLKDQYGVYDLYEDRRIRNREEIIRAFWDYGFATWRGRPPTVAQLRWSGPRKHLEHLTQMADYYWNINPNDSEVAKKICSAYRSINRYAAWPGAW